MMASGSGHIAIAQVLIKKGANINRKGIVCCLIIISNLKFHNYVVFQGVMTPLNIACLYGHSDIAEMLIDEGAKIDEVFLYK